MKKDTLLKKFTAMCTAAFISLVSCGENGDVKKDTPSPSGQGYTAEENAAAGGNALTITYAVATEPTAEEQAVIDRFNAADNGYEVEIRDYSEYYGSPDAQWFQITDEQRKAFTVAITQDIINGRVDVVRDQYLLSSNVMNILAEKGGLADLYPFMDNDSDVNKTTLNSHVLELHETDGKLYFLPTFYYISTLVGQTRYVGEKEGWTIEEFIDRWEKMPEGSTIGGYRQKDYVYMTLLQGALEQFIDNGTGEVHFDSPLFRRALEFCNTFDPPLTYYNEGDGQGADFVSGKLIDGFCSFNSELIQNADNEPVTFIGYPTESGRGSFINSETNRFGICAASSAEKQQGAWEFIKLFAMEEYQTENAYSTVNSNANGTRKEVLSSPRDIPVNLKVYDRLAHDIIDGRADFGLSEEDAGEITLTEAELNRLTDFINSIDRVSFTMDNDLRNMIKEEVMAYFSGEKGIDETIGLIQNRAEIIVSEKR